jgi:hypothetical protein
MSDAFGALTDHWGILALNVAGTDGDTLDTILEVTASSKVPQARSRSDARDRNNDIAEAAWHGNTAGEADLETLFDASVTYTLKAGSFSLAQLRGGEIVAATIDLAGKVIASFEIGTSNDGWPTITASGVIGARAIVAPEFPANALNTWVLPAITLTGAKRAQPLTGAGNSSVVIDEGEITGSSLSATLDIAQQEDGVGEPCAHGISGGVIALSVDIVRIDDPPAWTLGTDWNETQKPGVDEGQAAFHTTSAAAEKIWVRETSI